MLCMDVLSRGKEREAGRGLRRYLHQNDEEPLTCRDLFSDRLCYPSSSSSSSPFLSSSSSSFPTSSSSSFTLLAPLLRHAASAPSYSLPWGESVAPRRCIVVSVGFRVCLVNATALRVKGRQGEMGADWRVGGCVCFGRDFLCCQFVNS